MQLLLNQSIIGCGTENGVQTVSQPRCPLTRCPNEVAVGLCARTPAGLAMYAPKSVGPHMYEILVLAPKRPIRWPRVDFSGQSSNFMNTT